MAGGLEFFDRELRMATAGLDLASVQKELARFAKRSVADVVSQGIAPERYERFVNGKQGAVEESVQLPGPIVYEFLNWKLAIDTAIEELEKRAPKRSGRYSRSFIVISKGVMVSDYRSLPATAEVIIVNYQPYTRKAESGALGTGARHFDLAKGAFNRRFAEVFNAQHMFLNIGGGVHPDIPYVLKRAQRRKDRQAGAAITYPALVINAV